MSWFISYALVNLPVAKALSFHSSASSPFGKWPASLSLIVFFDSVSIAETLIQTPNVAISPLSASQILEKCKVLISSLVSSQFPFEGSRHCCFGKGTFLLPSKCEDQPFGMQHHLVR